MSNHPSRFIMEPTQGYSIEPSSSGAASPRPSTIVSMAMNMTQAASPLMSSASPRMLNMGSPALSPMLGGAAVPTSVASSNQALVNAIVASQASGSHPAQSPSGTSGSSHLLDGPDLEVQPEAQSNTSQAIAALMNSLKHNNGSNMSPDLINHLTQAPSPKPSEKRPASPPSHPLPSKQARGSAYDPPQPKPQTPAAATIADFLAARESASSPSYTPLPKQEQPPQPSAPPVQHPIKLSSPAAIASMLQKQISAQRQVATPPPPPPVMAMQQGGGSGSMQPEAPSIAQQVAMLEQLNNNIGTFQKVLDEMQQQKQALIEQITSQVKMALSTDIVSLLDGNILGALSQAKHKPSTSSAPSMFSPLAMANQSQLPANLSANLPQIHADRPKPMINNSAGSNNNSSSDTISTNHTTPTGLEGQYPANILDALGTPNSLVAKMLQGKSSRQSVGSPTSLTSGSTNVSPPSNDQFQAGSHQTVISQLLSTATSKPQPTNALQSLFNATQPNQGFVLPQVTSSSNGPTNNLEQLSRIASMQYQNQHMQSPIMNSMPRKRSRDEPEDGKVLQCTVPGCGKVFRRKSYLRNHMQIHNPHKAYGCDRCDSRYSQYAGLYMHYKQVHHEKMKKDNVRMFKEGQEKPTTPSTDLFSALQNSGLQFPKNAMTVKEEVKTENRFDAFTELFGKK